MPVKRTQEDADKQIRQVLDLVRTVLGENILGLYLYGSYTKGGLMPHSDIDLFVVLESPTGQSQKKQLIDGLFNISIEDSNDVRRPIELSMALQNELRPWTGLPNIDFQYGEWMRKDFEKGRMSPWTNPHMDLAIIVTQVLEQGKRLYGAEANELLDAVPDRDLKLVMVGEVDDLLPDLKDDTRNVLLTLVRIWNTLETGEIASKQDAATWALKKVPGHMKSALGHALEACLGIAEEDWVKYQKSTKVLADYLESKIKTLAKEL